MDWTTRTTMKIAGATSLVSAVALFSDPARAALLHSNGTLSTGAFTESGVPAPAGTTWSEMQHDAGNLTEANALVGATEAQGDHRMADDITIPPGEAWTITSIDLYGFAANFPGPPSPFGGYTMQIWDGIPAF